MIAQTHNSYQQLQKIRKLDESGFTALLHTSFSLFHGFYISRPADERGIIRQVYTRHLNRQEVEQNQARQDKMEPEAAKFLRANDQLKKDKDRPYEFETKQARFMYQTEKQLMQLSLEAPNFANVRARTSVDKQSQEKWLQILFNSHRFEVEKLIAPSDFCNSYEEEQLYLKTLKKIQNLPPYLIYPLETPGLFSSETQKQHYELLLEKKAQLIRKKLEAEKKLIFGEGNDFPIIHSNLGYGGLGSGRGPYATFTAKAIEHLKIVADRIICNHKLSKGQLRMQRSFLEKLPSDERLILLMNTFVDTYGRFQSLRFGSFEQIRQCLFQKGVKQQVSDPEALQPDDKIKQLFFEQQQHCLKMLASPTDTKSLSIGNAEEALIAETCLQTFFIEAKLAYEALDDLVVLIETKLEKDFSPEERLNASQAVHGAILPKIQVLNGTQKKRKGSSIIMNQNALDKLLSPEASEKVLSRQGSSIRTLRAVLDAIKVEECNYLQRYIEFFKIALELLQTIQSGQQSLNSPPTPSTPTH